MNPMRTGTCVKCRSAEVYAAFSKTRLETGLKAGSGQPSMNVHEDKVGMFGDSSTLLELEIFICRSCGYTEQYVSNAHELSRVGDARNWRKVEPGSS